MTVPEDMTAALCGTLEQVATLVEQLPPGAYEAPMPDCLDATIGQHLRHCLDHYATLASGLVAGELDYAARRRETEIETDPGRAVQVARTLAVTLADALEGLDLHADLRVRTACGRTGDIAWQRSSVGREIQFVVSHTVHHLAMVAASCRRRGLPVPTELGVAPSTLRHRDTVAARSGG